MAEIKVNPTRMEMKKLQARYATARKGHKLLKDKRDELMKQFLDIVREDKVVRERVEQGLQVFFKGFSIASAICSSKVLEESLLCPKKEGKIDVTYKNLMSVVVPCFETSIHGDSMSGTCNYGYAFTSGELDNAILSLNTVMADMIRMAELEKSAQLLAEEIEKTRRRVNALEYIMMPNYLEAIKSIRMKLDENERSNTTRLMKVKDMMLKEQIAKKRGEDNPEEE